MDAKELHRRRIFCLAFGCAQHWRKFNVEVDLAYVVTVAKALCMCVAHESDRFNARRQYGFASDPAKNDRGAFGLWQCEKGSVGDSLEWFRTHGEVQAIMTEWLRETLEETETVNRFMFAPFDQDLLYWTLRLVQDATPIDIADEGAISRGDVFSCVLARAHLWRRPGRIPGDYPAMADYLKVHYNTKYGSATPEKYLSAFRTEFPWLRNMEDRT